MALGNRHRRPTRPPASREVESLLLATSPAPRIAYLDGLRLHRALVAGIRSVLEHQDELNRINVFPVADADTGTNLAATLREVLEATGASPNSHAGTLLNTVAEAALDGARGNSGAIFAQFLQGFSESVGCRARLGAGQFAAAVREGAASAREALAEPQEGTILSVIGAYADALGRPAQGPKRDFLALMERSLEDARQALAETRHQLPQLERAGVVDAGALGFVAFLEGIHAFVLEGSLNDLPDARPAAGAGGAPACEDAHEDPTYRFCTECLVSGEGIDRQRLRAELGGLSGDSLVVAGTAQKVRVHCHVDNPAALFLACERFGEVTRQKADDMRRQQRTARTRQRVAVVTDSGADIPEEMLETLNIHVVPLRLQVDGRDYLDKVTLDAAGFYGALRRARDFPTTSQPPPGDFRRQFHFLAGHHETVLAVTLSAALSGTWQAARSAAARDGNGSVTVLDSRNAAAGQGLLVMCAAECARAGWSPARIVKRVEQLVPRTRTFALIADLRFAVRGGRVPRWFQWLADCLRLTPVLASNAAGRIKLAGVIPGRRRLVERFARRVARGLDPDRAWRILVGHCDCEAQGRELRRALVAAVPHVHSSYLTEAGTAIGAHAGPGSLVVAVQPYEPPGEEA